MGLKIAYIVNSQIPSRTANSVNVMNMCQAFAQHDSHIALFYPVRSSESDQNPFDFYGIMNRFDLCRIRINGDFKRELRFLYKAIKIAKKKEFDYIYVRELNALLWAHVLKISAVIELHGLPQTILNYFCLHYLKSSSMVSTISVISNALKKKYISLGVPARKMKVLPDAADTEKITYRPAIRKRGDVFTVGYAGHLYRGRGMDIIFKIAQALSSIRFIILGGNENDIRYWKDNSAKHNLTNVVFKGFIPNDRLAEYFLDIDIFLMPYQRKVSISGNRGNTADFMSPMKMFEYMASGSPIISSDLPVLREVLENGRNALLVPCDNVRQWVQAIKRLQGDEKLYKVLAENARHDVEQTYNWKNRVSRIIEQLEQEEEDACI